MKRFLILLPIVACAVLALGSLWQTPDLMWKTFRTVKAAEDSLPTAATQYVDADSTADGTIVFAKPVGAVCFSFRGTAAADKTMTWCLWARKSATDPREFVAYGTATTGASITGTANEFYADTIVITTESWYTDVSVVDDAPEAIIAGGGISKLIMDSCEYTVWEVDIYDIAGGGAECATAGADAMNFPM